MPIILWRNQENQQKNGRTSSVTKYFKMGGFVENNPGLSNLGILVGFLKPGKSIMRARLYPWQEILGAGIHDRSRHSCFGFLIEQSRI